MSSDCAKPNRSANRNRSVSSQGFKLDNLLETGRLQFFFHSPRSIYPIRDVVYKNKTEPHIEKCAENYISECYQANNIIPFLRSAEKYLFLFTTCKNPSIGSKYFKKRFIVGYIIKEKALRRRNKKGNHYAVQGKTKLFSFPNAYPLERLVKSNADSIRVKKFSAREVKTILNHFRDKKNILNICLNDLKLLKGQI